jgi:hypothetical protein
LNRGPIASLPSLTATLQRLASNRAPPFLEYFFKKNGSSFLIGQNAAERPAADMETETD